MCLGISWKEENLSKWLKVLADPGIKTKPTTLNEDDNDDDDVDDDDDKLINYIMQVHNNWQNCP